MELRGVLSTTAQYKLDGELAADRRGRRRTICSSVRRPASTRTRGLAIFDADPARLYTPLTRAEYDSIAARTVYHPKSRNDYGSFTLTNGELFSLPAGPVGFAANFEAGNQAYELNPDPLALEYYYFSWKDQDGHGSRNHWSRQRRVPRPLRREARG